MIQVVGVMHAKSVAECVCVCMHACIQRSNGLSITSHQPVLTRKILDLVTSFIIIIPEFKFKILSEGIQTLALMFENFFLPLKLVLGANLDDLVYTAW